VAFKDKVRFSSGKRSLKINPPKKKGRKK